MAKIITTLLISPFSTDVQYIEQTLARCIHCKIKLTIEQDISLAYSHLKSQHFDTILVDCGDKTNAQLEPIKTIKTGSENTNLAIIALVEQDTPAIYHQALQAGASDCLPMDQLTPSLLERSILHAIHQKTDETRLLKLANYDALTGLTNRSLFKTRLNQYISQTRRSEQQLALMIINLDNFYRVNEILGQDAGDELLAQAADRLHNCIRETDMVARLSGDEFAVVAAQLHGSDDASTLANGILQACHFAIESETVDITITCSIGVAVFPKDGDNSKRLLIQADTALRQSRDSGGNCFHFADLCLDKLTQQRQQLSADIGHALIRNQLRLHFQPIISIEDKSISGTEVLLRWQHPHRGLLKPECFLATAEASGLINPIGTWVIRKACEQHLEWLTQGLPPIPIAINLSLKQMQQYSLLKTVSDISKHKNFDVHYLSMELNEDDIYQFDTTAIDTLCELHDMGIHITVDNFGKNYSSLSKLHRLPIDTVKIDRSIIQGLSPNNDCAEIIDAIIQLCKALKIKVIAQGIEDTSSISYLNKKACSQMQGFGIAKPLTADDFPLWYNRYIKSQTQQIFH